MAKDLITIACTGGSTWRVSPKSPPRSTLFAGTRWSTTTPVPTITTYFLYQMKGSVSSHSSMTPSTPVYWLQGWAPRLRLEILYVPHIGIATLKDAPRCKELADELNGRRLSIGGKVDDIFVVEYNGKVVADLRHFTFGDNAA